MVEKTCDGSLSSLFSSAISSTLFSCSCEAGWLRRESERFVRVRLKSVLLFSLPRLSLSLPSSISLPLSLSSSPLTTSSFIR